MLYIEDLLEILSETSSKYSFKFQILKSDYNLMTSLGRQCVRQIGLTDRQYNLSKKKLLEYKDQFEENGILDIDQYFDNLRTPIREIDRSRWIKIVDGKIAVRFSFNKKLITSLENIRKELGQPKNFIDNIHYFELSEKSVYVIVSNLENKNFELSNDVNNIYEKCKEFTKNPYNHVPYVKDEQFLNFPKNLETLLVEELGYPNKNNLFLYKERSFKYNYKIDFPYIIQNKITEQIVNRNNCFVNFKPSEYNLEDVIFSIIELRKFPILIILKQHQELSQIKEFYSLFEKYINSKEQSVYFRLDNNTATGTVFNHFVKDKKINNPIDKNTKIVYISESKLPKPVIESNWHPSLLLSKESSRLNSHIETFSKTYCDLFLSADEVGVSNFKYRVRYGGM